MRNDKIVSKVELALWQRAVALGIFVRELVIAVLPERVRLHLYYFPHFNVRSVFPCSVIQADQDVALDPSSPV